MDSEPVPSGVQSSTESGDLVIRLSWVKPQAIVQLVFIGGFWTVQGVILAGRLIGPNWEGVIPVGLYFVPSVLMAYYALQLLINTTRIAIEPPKLVITNGPLPSLGNSRTEIDDVAGFEAINGELKLHRSDGEVVTVLYANRPEQAKFIARSLAARLNVPVRGSRNIL